MNQSNFIKPELDSMPPEVLDLIIQRTAGLVETKVDGNGGPEFEKQLCRLARISPRFKELSQAFMNLDLILNNDKEAKKWIEGGNRRFRVKDLFLRGNITMKTFLEITDFPRVTSTLYWISVDIEGVFDIGILRLPRFSFLTQLWIRSKVEYDPISTAYPFILQVLNVNEVTILTPELAGALLSDTKTLYTYFINSFVDRQFLYYHLAPKLETLFTTSGNMNESFQTLCHLKYLTVYLRDDPESCQAFFLSLLKLSSSLKTFELRYLWSYKQTLSMIAQLDLFLELMPSLSKLEKFVIVPNDVDLTSATEKLKFAMKWKKTRGVEVKFVDRG